jgi:hypothetical protein
MARSPKNQPRSSSTPRWPLIGLILTLLSPLTVFVAVAGLKAGLWPIGVAYDTLTLQVGAWLALLGILGVIVTIVSGAMAFRQSWLVMIVAAAVSAGTVSLYLLQMRGVSDVLANKADPAFRPGAGVSTDPVDQVGFSTRVMAERLAEGADPLVVDVGHNGCAISSVSTQTAPGVAGYALQEAGFEIRDLGVNRANGVHVSVWFDRTYDAAIRIRPGRTDLRVTPRDGLRDGGTSCRLAKTILSALQPSR